MSLQTRHHQQKGAVIDRLHVVRLVAGQYEYMPGGKVYLAPRGFDPQVAGDGVDAHPTRSLVFTQAGAQLERRQHQAEAAFLHERARVAVTPLPARFLFKGGQLSGEIEIHDGTYELARGSLVATAGL